MYQQQQQRQLPLRRSRTFGFENDDQDTSRRSSSIRRSQSIHEQPSDLQRRRSTTIQDQLQQRIWGRFTPHHHHRLEFSPGVSSKDMARFNQYYNFRARCATTFISLTELKGYVDINRKGFDKILKKWDKVTGSNLRTTYNEKMITSADPFLPHQMTELEKAIFLVRDMYAAIFTQGDPHAATSELKLHMRDHIQFERTTVWKDLVGKERMTMDAHAADVKEGYQLPFGLFLTKHALRCSVFLMCAVIPYGAFMSIDVFNDVPASKCLGLLLCAAIMWAFECLPIYATAYLIPLLVPTMDIIQQNGVLVDAKTAAKLVFSSMFNGTIMVLLGGFAIAAALSKHGVARAFATVILSHAGTRPSVVILINMYMAAFLSMWISNVATPVLCTTLVEPILRTLPPRSTVGPCLILGISLASCIGGLTSPISSPQNIIAINIMQPSPGWGNWFAASLPVAIITIFTTWGCLLLYFRPDRSTRHLNTIRALDIAYPSLTQIFVSVVCLTTIGLWCSETAVPDFWGDNGVIAAIPIVLFFGTGVLSKTDLNNFLWPVVILAQGGMALGFAVQSSGLLDIIGHRIASGVEHLGALDIVFIFGIIVLVFATFVSHTVAALIILPIVQQVGEKLSPPHPNLLVMVTGLVSSVAFALPVSGFPNMNAFMQEDLTGKPYLKIKDFIFCGVPASIIAGVITILLGYGIISRMINN
ncbi:Sodium:sulfate symporter transmembrane region-domain-containing protein [Halteromyces radiatus]|uniref:Sodium:sulfate symporter transmembrane region-domain-containing protein n=1 Tax=Halteromyces radiatus TaxID=101107 RepID=UPI00221FDED9|nr:Sodium:sulfate symporter transmembrane region-domain-containing protein [Halteromyces radiatus]KAI8084955.1 Sodium:sulfate symporter transmembrane region-domain-containing protein [Halteromyces radiatus]